MSRSITIFLLVASFGILFAGCAAPEPDRSMEDFTFTDTDLETVQEMTSSHSTGQSVLTETGSEDFTTGTIELSVSGSSSTITDISPDKEKQKSYDNIRMAVMDQGENLYRVNNPFLNVRASTDVSSALVVRLDHGDVLTVTDLPSAQWAKVKLSDGKTGYVAFRYIAKLTTEQKLPQEKKQFEGKYFVDFQFVNVRKDPSTQSEKVGELPGQAIVKPISVNSEWARVTVDGKEGYVSMQYLKPFLPVFLVRQDEYSVPILQYQASDSASIALLAKHVASLKAAGKKVQTLRSLYDVVLTQETNDARISPDVVILTVAGVTLSNVKQVADALQSAGVGATLFIRTKDVGLTGITEKTILNLMANGNDLQSAGHNGDDLRSMTDSEVRLQLGQSKKLIEEISRKEVYAIAYPSGGVNDRVMKMASEMGYLFGLTQSPDKKFTRTQFLRLPSLYVSSGMTAEDVVKLVK